MRALAAAVLLVLAAPAQAQGGAFPDPFRVLRAAETLAFLNELDAPALLAYGAAYVGPSVPLAVTGLAFQLNQNDVRWWTPALACISLGPTLGFVVAGEGDQAFPGLLIRSGAVTATAALVYTTPRSRYESVEGTLLLMGTLAGGGAVVLLSASADERRLRRLLREQTRARRRGRAARPDVSLAPLPGGAVLALRVPLP